MDCKITVSDTSSPLYKKLYYAYQRRKKTIRNEYRGKHERPKNKTNKKSVNKDTKRK